MNAPPTDRLRDAYLATVLDLLLPDGRQIAVMPRPLGVREGRFPADIGHVHVVTASNPRSQPLLGPENERRNQLLRRELLRLVQAPHQISPARGCSSDGRWCEESFAVFDADREAVIDIATLHGQLALYEWAPSHLSVVWTAPERADDVQGWAVSER